MKKLLLIFLLFFSFNSFSQNDSIKQKGSKKIFFFKKKDSIKQKDSEKKDSIKFKNDNVLVGEIKSLINGVITMKTSFSDKDFKIEYKEVEEIYLNQTFLINLANGGHYLGTARTTNPGIAEITDDKNLVFETKIENITMFKESGTNFWSRFKGNIDLGFNFTKSNNAVQFNVNSDLKYVGKRWNFNASYSNTINDQDDVDQTKRIEWDLDAQRFLVKDYYGIAQISFLSNTEQALKGRTTTLLGVGKYVFNTNRLYLGLRTGLNYNIETYFDESLDKNSMDVNLSTGFNMFDFNDFNLDTTITGYYSLTESNRFRFDYGITLKYDMPWDFYIKFDFSLNYDNQPADTGSEFDYNFTSGFGWELK